MLSNLKQLRKKAGLSQDELGKAVGMTRTTYLSREKNPSDLTLEEIKRLSKALNIDFDELIGTKELKRVKSKVQEASVRVKATKCKDKWVMAVTQTYYVDSEERVHEVGLRYDLKNRSEDPNIINYI